MYWQFWILQMPKAKEMKAKPKSQGVTRWVNCFTMLVCDWFFKTKVICDYNSIFNPASQGFYHAWGEEKPWLPLVTWLPEYWLPKGGGKSIILHASTSALYTSIASSECSVPINFENRIFVKIVAKFDFRLLLNYKK
jgi:hypothetical protein